MYHYRNVINGLTKFVDHELTPKMTGLNKWLFGTGAGIIASKGEHVFHSLKDNPLLHTLELIEEENINGTCIYKELLRQAEHGPIHIDIPMIGTVTLDKSDVEKCYEAVCADRRHARVA